VAHLYNLRRAAGYQRARGALPQKTQSTRNAIGERRAPQPNNLPGFIRVASVHQGDLDGLHGLKGVYLINAVDTVTRFQFIAAVERISEHHLLPVLHGSLARFPFVLRGFHADYGTEYINHRVAKLLDKLNIERRATLGRLASLSNGVYASHRGLRQHCSPHHERCSHHAFPADLQTPEISLTSSRSGSFYYWN
jgi:hypothetical protein